MQYSPEQLERLWQYRETLITSFLHFVNYTLLSESILLAMVGVLASSEKNLENFQYIVIALGISITILWMYIQGKQRAMLNDVRKECEKSMHEFSLIMGNKRSSFWKVSNTWLLAYFLPSLFLICWGFLIFIL